MDISITVIRKGASKSLSLATSKSNCLSICQIFESTNDVVGYSVAELKENYVWKDMYLPNMHGFSKWQPVAEIKQSNG